MKKTNDFRVGAGEVQDELGTCTKKKGLKEFRGHDTAGLLTQTGHILGLPLVKSGTTKMYK